MTNPTNFGNCIHKNTEIIINHIRQMSNNFFKLGYFKPIHSICFEFIRLIDNYTPFKLANLIINNVLFDQIIINPKKQNQNTNVIFNQNNILSLFGFNANIPTPFLLIINHDLIVYSSSNNTICGGII